jgi:hypothetical protein
MARLTTKQRKMLPATDFAGPDRSYPVEDASHARNALARASQFASPAVKSAVQAKVARKFPGIQQTHHSPKRKSGNGR